MDIFLGHLNCCIMVLDYPSRLLVESRLKLTAKDNLLGEPVSLGISLYILSISDLSEKAEMAKAIGSA